MKKQAATVLLLSLLAGQGGADEVVTFTVNSEPPGATIFNSQGGNNAIGTSGEPLTFRFRDSQPVTFHLVLEGYETLSLPIEPYMLKLTLKNTHGLYPEHALRLPPKHWWQPLARQPALPLGLLALAGTSLFGLGRFRARLARAERLEQLKAEAHDSDGSLVMHVLGGYRLVELLGKGGMATVYRALRENTLDRADSYACKVIQRDQCRDGEFRDRFKREFKVSQELQHPGIVRVFDWGETEDGRLFLIMEEVRGGTLRQALVDPLPFGKAMRLLEPLFEAVTYAHEKGVIHRDLKPENVMLDERGQMKIMDFGLARKVDSESHLTKTGTALGTPAYMAPEQIQGLASAPAADQYALGIMAYEMLTGRLPFLGEDLVQMLYAHLSEEPPSPRELRPDLPAGANAVLLRMLKKQPEQRFPNVAAALQALRSAMGVSLR